MDFRVSGSSPRREVPLLSHRIQVPLWSRPQSHDMMALFLGPALASLLPKHWALKFWAWGGAKMSVYHGPAWALWSKAGSGLCLRPCGTKWTDQFSLGSNVLGTYLFPFKQVENDKAAPKHHRRGFSKEGPYLGALLYPLASLCPH